MKISILLPYKENFSPEYPGAVSLFVYETSRISKYKKQIVICITNLSSKSQKTKIDKNNGKIKNLLGSEINIENKKFLVLKPFETVWLSNN